MVRASGGMSFSDSAADEWAAGRGIPVPFDPKAIFSDAAADSWAADRGIAAQRTRHIRSRAAAALIAVPGDVPRIVLYGRDAEADAPPAILRRAIDATEQALTTALTTADGAKWVFDERQRWERAWFGATDYAGIGQALNNALYRIQPKAADSQAVGGAKIVPGDGGDLRLGPGVWMVDEPIVMPSQTGLVGAGCSSTVLKKSATWPAGATLLSHRGGAPTNTSEGVSGRYHKNHNRIQHLTLHGNDKTGLVLDSSYSSVARYDDLLLYACPQTAWLLEETWDSRFYGVDLGWCGGTAGIADAAMRITSSAYDMSNLLRFYGMRHETFRNCAIAIEKGPGGGSLAPYLIEFDGLKLESNVMPDNAVQFYSSPDTNTISIRDAYLNLRGTVPRTGLRGIDLDGQGHIVDGLMASVGDNASVISIVRAPRGQRGGTIRNVRVGVGGTGAALQMTVEVDNLKASGNPAVYDHKAMIIDEIRETPGIPMVGSTTADGLKKSRARIRQLEGMPVTVKTGTDTIWWNEMNRIIPFNHATAAANFVIDLNLGYIGDVITVSQEGAAAATLVPWTGVTLQVPSGLSATTAGQYTQVRARKIAANTWRVF